MGLEQKINYQLNKYPALKKIIKRTYQVGMYAISKKIKSEGNIVAVFLLMIKNMSIFLDIMISHLGMPRIGTCFV